MEEEGWMMGEGRELEVGVSDVAIVVAIPPTTVVGEV